MIKSAYLILLLLTILPLFDAQSEGKVIKIGWIGPLSGNSAVLGIDSLKAAELAVSHLNSENSGEFEFKLIAEDDQYVSRNTVNAYRKMRDVDNVEVFIVLTYGGIFALADVAQREGTFIIDPLDCDMQIAALNENVICIAKETEGLGTLAADLAVDKGEMPIGIVYFEGDPFPKTTAENANRRLKERGAVPILYEGYSGGAADFRPLVQRIKSRGVRSLLIYGYDELGILTKQIKEASLNVKLYALGTILSPGFQATAQGSANGATIIMWLAEGGELLADFKRDFREKEGRLPLLDIATVPTYDVVNLLGQAVRQGAFKVDEVKKFFYQVRDYRGASGRISVDSDGITRSFNHSVRIFKDGVAEAQ